MKNGLITLCVTMDSRRLNPSELVRSRILHLQNRYNLMEQVPRNVNGQGRKFFRAMQSAVEAGNHNEVRALLDSHVTAGNYDSYIDPLMNTKNAYLLEAHNRSMTAERIRQRANEYVWSDVQIFFRFVQTVICTGIDGIAPQEHKDFLRGCIVHSGVNPPSGKYLVTELSAPYQGIPKAVIPKTVLTVFSKKENIENVLKGFSFIPGCVVMEQNGVPKLFAEHNGVVLPMVFRNGSVALEWLESYFEYMGWGWPEPAEKDSCMLRYLLPTMNDRGEQDELTISYIQQADVESYVEQTMMLLMELEEYLVHPELMAEVPGLDMKQDAANVTMQKLIAYASRNYKQVRKVCSTTPPILEETHQEAVSLAEEYKWRPYKKPAEPVVETEPETAMDILPKKRVLFLGGHANMVKKLRQFFPDWSFLTDNELGSWTGGACDVIFFWSNHCSHLLWEYVNARKEKDTPYLYVTATNIDRLISEMAAKYTEYRGKKPFAAVC